MKILRILERKIKKLISPFYPNYRGHQRRSKQRKPSYRVNSINRIMLSMVNKERRKRGLGPVVFDKSLESHAIRWSNHMASQRELSHSGTILENCCMVPSSRSSHTITRRMFYCWKSSPPHWAWMMNSSIRYAALGYANRGRYAYGAYAFR